MFYSDDPIRDAEHYYANMEEETAKRPVCACCGFHIVDDVCFRIDGDLYCEDCMHDEFAVNVDDLMDEEF